MQYVSSIYFSHRRPPPVSTLTSPSVSQPLLNASESNDGLPPIPSIDTTEATKTLSRDDVNPAPAPVTQQLPDSGEPTVQVDASESASTEQAEEATGESEPSSRELSADGKSKNKSRSKSKRRDQDDIAPKSFA
jgi:hypothetical protein